MEKTFAQGMEVCADVTTTTITQDETSMAVANLTSMLDNNQSISPTSIGAHENVRQKNRFTRRRSFNCWIFSNWQIDNANQYQERANQRNSDEELKRSAGEILNGVKRTVEVQVVNPPNTFNFQDSSILGECGLWNPCS